MLEEIKAIQYKGLDFSEITEIVAVETAVKLECGKYKTDLFFTPQEIEEFAIGHLVSKDLIEKKDDIKSLKISGNKKNGFKIKVKIREKEEKTILKEDMEIDPEVIYSMNEHVVKSSDLFLKSGAFHYAYIFDTLGRNKYSAYDIGRMNAIDKVIGKCIMDDEGLQGKILYTTGRIASRSVKKAVNAGIGMIVSKAPPMHEAIIMAKRNNVIIIGFSRGKRFTIY